ncbi:toll-like receptor 4 [Ceratitis capitata]|uniref:toll-like receptor 4 n=1 Tax=Ceratitis capitata TaxID=7213 RepID=UPI000329B612|nr:toll-like receptor 4 [Ceratitis capitata]
MNLLHNSSGIESLTVKSYVPVSPKLFLKLHTLKRLKHVPKNLKELANNLSDYKNVNFTTEHFQNLTALKKLTLISTFSKSLPENIFSSLGELEFLSLRNNKLSEIPESSFAAQEKLVSLVLRRNYLKYLPEKLFENTRSLRYLCLSDNYFSNPSNIIASTKPLVNLNRLDLSHNKLRTITGNDSHVNETLLTNFEQLEDFSSQISNKEHNGGSQRRHFIWLDLSFNFMEIFQMNWYNKIRTKYPIITRLSNNQNYHIYLALSLFDEYSPYTRKIFYAANPKECYESLYTVNYLQADVYEATDQQKHDGVYPINWSRTFWCKICEPRHQSQSAMGATRCDNNRLFECTQLNVSHNQLTVIRHTQLPANLSVLDVSHNHLTHLSADFLDLYQLWTRLSLDGNPWRCDCDAEALILTVKAFRSHIPDVDQLHCDNIPARGIVNLSFTEICIPQVSISIPVYIGVSSTSIVALIIVGISLKYSLQLRIWLHSHNICRRFINECELYKNKNFDAFISYAHQDEQFVNKTLLPGLEEGPTPFRICTHERNWLAGAYIPEQIIESVAQSSRTIIVLSQHFIESDWARMEFRMALQSSLNEGRSRLVIIKYGEIVKSSLLDRELRAYLSLTTYLDSKDERFWHKLRYALPHRKGEVRDAGMLETGRSRSTSSEASNGLELLPISTSSTFLKQSCGAAIWIFLLLVSVLQELPRLVLANREAKELTAGSLCSPEKFTVKFLPLMRAHLHWIDAVITKEDVPSQLAMKDTDKGGV